MEKERKESQEDMKMRKERWKRKGEKKERGIYVERKAEKIM